jgi:hypothetical protein
VRPSKLKRKKSNYPFADDMILYVENPTDCQRKLLELINKFSKVAVYKITYKNQQYLHMPIIN